jgi:hypothetical protein
MSFAEQFQAEYDRDGIRAGIDYLTGVKKELDDMSKDVGLMIKAAQEVAVKQGLAAWVDDDPRELAPSKERFIELFGIETFNRVKAHSKPRRIFTWMTTTHLTSPSATKVRSAS